MEQDYLLAQEIFLCLIASLNEVSGIPSSIAESFALACLSALHLPKISLCPVKWETKAPFVNDQDNGDTV